MADVLSPPPPASPPEEHGLTYPPGFLSTLPTLLSRPTPHAPIRALSAAQFADLHLRSQLAHAPDGVLFPFLHGLEGDNEAQNSFFATGYARAPDGRRGRARVPHFRGLIWVAAEEDAESGEESDDDDDYDDYSSDIDVDPPEGADADADDNNTFAMDMDAEPSAPVSAPAAETATFMHPVQSRHGAPPPTPPLDGGGPAGHHHERSPTASSTSSAPPSPTFTTASYATSLSSAPPSPVCDGTTAAAGGCATPLPTGMLPRLTSTFKAHELLETNEHGEARFARVRVPEGISLRNFGIQVPIYATLSDIVVYSRRGAHRAAFALAEKFKQAVEAKYAERTPVPDGEPEPVRYNVFVLQATPEDMVRDLGYALTRTDTDAPHTDGHDAHVHGGPNRANTVNFAQREKDEMRDLTRASEILHVGDDDARSGKAFLGNHNDVPLAAPGESTATPFVPGINDPAKGFGYDVCIECHDRAPVPTAAHLRAAEEHLIALNAAWARTGESGERPPPAPGAIIHFPFPSSPSAINTVLPMLEFLQRVLEPTPAPSASATAESVPAFALWPRRRAGSTTAAPPPLRTVGRGARVLIWSSDGYTESSVLALCLLMAVRGLSLAEAYLELQVAKKRSFFVYHTDLTILRRVDAKLAQARAPPSAAHSRAPSYDFGMLSGTGAGQGRPVAIHRGPSHAHSNTLPSSLPASYPYGAGTPQSQPLEPANVVARRPRASTSPLLPALVHNHQMWFDDPRFDGSFPSRVLPFLYLGNLNHASNAYMLHALGITHVVSVGECALVPPPELHGAGGNSCAPADAGHEGAAGGRAHAHVGQQQGSLWIEEREGRIKVLDIKGVCDDGIDTLEPQLEPICEWIERARREGGQVLVHCRVGVSRSATVTIAYVMKHLNLPLVDAYLIVRSRRLSVLIQPNMRLLYNLCGWEVKLARERAAEGGDGAEPDADRLRAELARALNWPYLAREVHALNEKYLH